MTITELVTVTQGTEFDWPRDDKPSGRFRWLSLWVESDDEVILTIHDVNGMILLLVEFPWWYKFSSSMNLLSELKTPLVTHPDGLSHPLIKVNQNLNGRVFLEWEEVDDVDTPLCYPYMEMEPILKYVYLRTFWQTILCSHPIDESMFYVVHYTYEGITPSTIDPDADYELLSPCVMRIRKKDDDMGSAFFPNLELAQWRVVNQSMAPKEPEE